MRSQIHAPMALAWALIIPVCANAASVAPFSFDTAYGRLPKTVVPLDYSVSVTPNAAELTLAGTESIVLNFRQSTPHPTG